MELRCITLVTENCETIDIDAKHIGRFVCEGIKTNWYSKQDKSSYISGNQTAGLVFIEIFKPGDLPYHQFDMRDRDLTVLDRLNPADNVCAIEIKLKGYPKDQEPNPYYCIPWDGSNDYVNKWQYTYLSKAGNLYILFAKNANEKMMFSKFINHEFVDDPDNYNEKIWNQRLTEIRKEYKERDNSRDLPEFEVWLDRNYPDHVKKINVSDHWALLDMTKKYAEYLEFAHTEYPWYGRPYPIDALREAGIVDGKDKLKPLFTRKLWKEEKSLLKKAYAKRKE